MEIKRLVGGNIESNGYILFEKKGDACFIVDPGYNGEKFLKETAAAGRRLLGILLTHHHYDHTGGIQKILSAADCPVYMHRNDIPKYKGRVDVALDGGESLLLGAETIQALHTPGHTRGSVCFHAAQSGLCFTGDTVFNVDLGRTDLPDGSDAEMEASVRNVVSRWDNATRLYPGHGDPCNMKFVRAHNAEYLTVMGEMAAYKPWNGEAFMK
ncbi:MAG: MBL fold metallo-hydrolase [Clostridiales Family XIII bacterium]|jgi:glyoxylase-like metal-dependent hydrolase (beta-lactamase superfamily II)|nr:MBL fold metallo-hydrolase [Clostridiales Family XIII bacterium]